MHKHHGISRHCKFFGLDYTIASVSNLGCSCDLKLKVLLLEPYSGKYEKEDGHFN